MVKIAYVGNFRPEHSTENDVRRTLEGMGHVVERYQEDETGEWDALLEDLRVPTMDTILWTSTYDYSQRAGREVQNEMLFLARKAGVPTVGFHLDRWWGLDRWRRVLTEPFFRCEHVFTADGAHQEQFANAGVNHHWSPPAIAPHNVKRGIYRSEFACDVLFVGNWQGGYHAEWTHRPHLIKHLRRKWGKRLLLLPVPGGPAVRGDDLADAYASARVVVGDSCLVPTVDGKPMHHYCSDRVFETIGRGGYLLHPQVYGVIGYASQDFLLHYGAHLMAWHLDEWGELDAYIAEGLDRADINRQIRDQGFEHVKSHHTYANRLQAILDRVLP